MKTTGLALVALLTVGTAFGQNKLNLDTEASIINWTGSKVVGNSHSGTIAFKSGTLEVKGSKIVGGTFIADMTTLEDTDLSGGMKTKLEGHLKSGDFFGVEENPTAQLVITKVGKGKDGSAQVTGDLTIKGKTEQITFPALLNIENGVAIATAQLTFDRSKFDVRYGSDSFFDNLGNKAISDDVKISVSLKAN